MKKSDIEKPFLLDITELRRRARQHIERGAVTHGYQAGRKAVIRILNEVLATEIVCVLRYKRHYYWCLYGWEALCLEGPLPESSGDELSATPFAFPSSRPSPR